MAAFEWTPEGKMIMTDIAVDKTVDEVRAASSANFEVSPDLKTFE
jgi:acyl CoA:acetate/3-ketoacid CoA transferase beta subunit